MILRPRALQDAPAPTDPNSLRIPCIGIFDFNRKLLPCGKTKQKIMKFFVDSGIVKTCDELDLMFCPIVMA